MYIVFTVYMKEYHISDRNHVRTKKQPVLKNTGCQINSDANRLVGQGRDRA